MNKRLALALSALIAAATPALAAEPRPTLSLSEELRDQSEPADGAQLNGSLPVVELPDPVRLPETIDLTAPVDDLWTRIRHGFSMPNLNNELVLQQQTWYMNRPDQVRRIVERSSRYLYHIVEEIEKRGMPMELALLPMVESAYNPMALSPARASGLWQFIPSTGRNYKLEQNAWIDERRDIVASTSAALDYLQAIYDMHGDWHLALASYNWGENAVARAIAKNAAKGLPTDYLSLNMPPETRHYVPKLQALKNIFSSPKLMASLDLPRIANKPYFSTVPKPADMDVKVAAKLAEMPLKEFVALNPANKRPLIKEQTHLILPADKVEVFQANLENHDAPLSSWQSYTVQPGDRLDKIAARHGMTLAQLKAVNGIGKGTRVAPGTPLMLASNREALADFGLPPARADEPAKPARVGKENAKRGKATPPAGKTSPKSTVAKSKPSRKAASSSKTATKNTEAKRPAKGKTTARLAKR